jgi:hyaluronoglucosaminidase
VNYSTLTPVDTGTGRTGKPIRLGLGVGDHADAIVITPDGKTAYVAAAFTVVPIQLAHRRAGQPIRLGNHMSMQASVVMTPDGRKLYVLTSSDLAPLPGDVIPVDTTTGKAGRPITRAGAASAIAMAPDGKAVYAGSTIGEDPASAGVVIPISTSTNKVSKPIKVGRPGPLAGVSSLAVTPDGEKIYVAAQHRRLPGGHAHPQGRSAHQSRAARLHPDCARDQHWWETAWVLTVNCNSRPAAGLLTRISINTNNAGEPIHVGTRPVCLLIIPGHPDPHPEQGTCPGAFR